jgi:hypothetical protein
MTSPGEHQHHVHPLTDEEQVFVRALGMAVGMAIRENEAQEGTTLSHEQVVAAAHQALHQIAHIVENHGIAAMQPVWERAAVDGYLDAGDSESGGA